MSPLDLSTAQKTWPAVEAFVYVPHTEQEYRQLVVILDSLLDQVGEDEQHPMASLAEVIGVLVERYEDEHVPVLRSGQDT